MRQEGLTRDEGWLCSLERADVKSTVLSAGGDVRRRRREKRPGEKGERKRNQGKSKEPGRFSACYRDGEPQKS